VIQKKNRPVEWYGVATAVARRQRVQRLACEKEANIKKTEEAGGEIDQDGEASAR